MCELGMEALEGEKGHHRVQGALHFTKVASHVQKSLYFCQTKVSWGGEWGVGIEEGFGPLGSVASSRNCLVQTTWDSS